VRRNLKLTLATGSVAAVVAVVGAFAYFTSAGTGTGSAAVGTLAATTITSHSATGDAVSLTWSAVTPPASGTVSYYVLRDGGAAGGNCGTAASPITTLTCTDNAPSASSPTTYSYVVVAVWRSWKSTSASVSQFVKGDQTITFTSTAPANAKVGGATYTVTATGGGSGNPVTFTSGTPSVCTSSGTNGATITFVGAGSCTVNADQAGNANYNAAPQAQETFTVARGDQTITFTSTAPASAKVGGATYTATATATSGLTVTFTSATPAVCTSGGTNGATFTFVATGTCTINANQAGDANWNVAPQAQQTFTVAKGDQTITFTSTAPASAKVGGATYTATATATSGLTVSFSSATPSVCTSGGTNGATFTFVATGTCTINANQVGNANWNAAPQAQQSFAVASSLTISTVVRDGGNKKVHFTGTGAVASTTITVTICAVNSFPCASPVATSSATSPSAGNWTSAASNNNLATSQTYFAQAVQGTSTSAVFTFSTTGL
jgi:hypothetical protein